MRVCRTDWSMSMNPSRGLREWFKEFSGQKELIDGKGSGIEEKIMEILYH